MKKPPGHFVRILQQLVIVVLALGVFMFLSLGARSDPAHALPEYAERMGEPCAACHVNPGGGGPRTLQGLLWSARGRPDALPELPGLLLAPGVSDGQELYEIACAGCHGLQGEGLSTMPLAGSGISAPAIRSYLLFGIPQLGMPSFEGKLNADQIEALVSYLGKLANGEIAPPQGEILLPPANFRCDPLVILGSCGSD